MSFGSQEALNSLMLQLDGTSESKAAVGEAVSLTSL
jgi:hypothetical protein